MAISMVSGDGTEDETDRSRYMEVQVTLRLLRTILVHSFLMLEHVWIRSSENSLYETTQRLTVASPGTRRFLINVFFYVDSLLVVEWREAGCHQAPGEFSV